MFRSLKPNASHVMVPMSDGQGIKCALCGATGLQERVELPCPESDVAKLRERIAELETILAELLNDFTLKESGVFVFFTAEDQMYSFTTAEIEEIDFRRAR